MKTVIGFVIIYLLALGFSSVSKANVANIQDIRGCIELSNGNDAVYFDCMSQYSERLFDQDSKIEDAEMRLDRVDESLMYLEVFGE